MGNQDYFEHDGLDGRTPFDRMADAGFRGAGPMGENIQAGSASAMDATESLMSSPPHCRNIMNPEYRVLGTGHAFVAGSGYGDYWTQNFGGSH
jgi:uncharacterized protein YkwD